MINNTTYIGSCEPDGCSFILTLNFSKFNLFSTSGSSISSIVNYPSFMSLIFSKDYFILSYSFLCSYVNYLPEVSQN